MLAKIGGRLILADNLLHSRNASNQTLKRRLDLKQHAPSPRGDQWYVANELQRVADALLGVQKNARAIERHAAPRWSVKPADVDASNVHAPAPFVVDPSLGELAAQ